jgi:hypothetical protein
MDDTTSSRSSPVEGLEAVDVALHSKFVAGSELKITDFSRPD